MLDEPDVFEASSNKLIPIRGVPCNNFLQAMAHNRLNDGRAGSRADE